MHLFGNTNKLSFCSESFYHVRSCTWLWYWKTKKL